MNLDHLKNKIAIVGVGYTPQGKVPGRTAISFHCEADVYKRQIYDNAELIAKEAVEETGYGRVDSKILKITRCTTAAWHYLHDKKSVGMIDWDPVEKLATLSLIHISWNSCSRL